MEDHHDDEEEGLIHSLLPPEVMQHIMGLADPASVSCAAAVCRAWHEICQSPYVWEAVYRHHFSRRPHPQPKLGWRDRCVKAAISLRRLQAPSLEEPPQRRLVELIKWCAACGHELVLEELLRVEGANITLDMLNGYFPTAAATDASQERQLPFIEPSARPMHLAALIGSAAVIEVLALAGADVNAANGRGNTPVGIAATKGFLDAVEVLLRHGAGGSDFTRLVDSQQKRRWKGTRPLAFQAAAGGHVKIMEVLLERAGGPEQALAMVNAAEERTGKTALHYAAENGHTAMAALLLRHGADINALTPGRQWALRLATLNGHLSTVRLLIGAGARFTIDDAAQLGSAKKVVASPLHVAAGQQHEAFVRLFLESGVSINLAGADGRTPLHMALRGRTPSPAFIRLLLDLGADPQAVDATGQGVLGFALQSAHRPEDLDICRMLVAAGADVHLKNPTPCLRALCEDGCPVNVLAELLDFLAEHGINWLEPEVCGSMLEVAARQCYLEIVRFLLDRGVSPQGANDGTAPLYWVLSRYHYSDVSNRLATARLLLERGAELTVQRYSSWERGMPALTCLTPRLADLPLVDLLLEYGADINGRNENSDTFLFMAATWMVPWSFEQLRLQEEFILALLQRGADPRLCRRSDGSGAYPLEGYNRDDSIVSAWESFLREQGFPPTEQIVVAEQEGETEEDEEEADQTLPGEKEEKEEKVEDGEDEAEE